MKKLLSTLLLFFCLAQTAGAQTSIIRGSGGVLASLIVSASVDPTVNDDSGDGYIVGTKWFNDQGDADPSNDTVFQAVSVTLADALWVQIYPAPGSATPTLSSVLAAGNSYFSGTSPSTGLIVGEDANNHGTLYWDLTTGGPKLRCVVAGVLGNCNINWHLNSGYVAEFEDSDGQPIWRLTESTGRVTFPTTSKQPLKSIWFGAGSLSTDGTQCAAPAEVTINSGPKLWTIICADNDASTIYGSVKMPDSWNAGTVTFTHVYIQTAADTGVLNGDIACQARSNGEVPSSTWGTEVALDDAAVVGSNSNDMTTSAAATCAGTGVAGGDMLYFRYQLDATGTTTGVTTLHHLGFMLEYAVTGLSD